MVRYIQTQPEVIFYLISLYSEEQLPDWMGQLDEEGAPPRDEGTPPIMDEHDPTTYEDPTTYDEDVEEDAPVQPVQAKGIERERKMVVGHGTTKKKVVVPSGGVVVGVAVPRLKR